ncbi:MAG TPA: CerR family C-terminal domain-containing protein [Tepidisphaeraceae bacterium]|jgi:AcrR family transcriptional regulator|nr:CerR family C-terminal domain-containing protein [Tepidisphaeraceae bacterium]
MRLNRSIEAGSNGEWETRQRLLEAAGEIFAEQGYRHATVREICRRAGANVAAVNYHFGGKTGLYGQVLRYAHEQSCAKYPPPAPDKNGTPRQRLLEFVRSFLLRMLDEGRPAWHGKLTALEMIEPTEALDRLVEEGIRPRALCLESIVRELVGIGASKSELRLCTMSVVSQCLFYQHCRAVITRLYPDFRYDSASIERLAEHITRFSLNALKRWRRKAKGRRS